MAWLLIVIPLSRSISMLSRIWSWKFLSLTTPVCWIRTVGQGRFAMVDMGDDAEVPNIVHNSLVSVFLADFTTIGAFSKPRMNGKIATATQA